MLGRFEHMKVKEGFILKEIAGSFVVMPTGEALVDFNMMLTLNETGVFLWNILEKGAGKEELLSAVLEEYNIDGETAKADIDEFVDMLISKKVIEE